MVADTKLNLISQETQTKELNYRLKLLKRICQICIGLGFIIICGMLFFNFVRGVGFVADPNVIAFIFALGVVYYCLRQARKERYQPAALILTLIIAFLSSFAFFQMTAQMPALFLGALFPILLAHVLLDSRWAIGLTGYFVVVACSAIFLQDVAKVYVPFFTSDVPNYPFSQMLATIIMLPAIFVLFAAPYQMQNRILSEQNEKLIEYGASLEEKVLERTQELALASTRISKLNLALQTENQRLSTELEIARKIQEMILPKEKELEAINSLDIAAFMSPASEVGGDYYDILQGEQDGQLTIGIGDVTGHGLESGMLMLMAQTAIRTMLATNEFDLGRFLATVNQALYYNIERMALDKSLTLTLLDYHNGKISISGQHEDIIVVRSDGKLEQIDTTDLGIPVGLQSDISDFLNQQQLILNPADMVVLYTDGLTEAKGTNGNRYGLQRLCQIIQTNYKKTISATQLKTVILEDLFSFIGQQKIADDITLLVLKQK